MLEIGGFFQGWSKLSITGDGSVFRGEIAPPWDGAVRQFAVSEDDVRALRGMPNQHRNPFMARKLRRPKHTRRDGMEAQLRRPHPQRPERLSGGLQRFAGVPGRPLWFRFQVVPMRVREAVQGRSMMGIPKPSKPSRPAPRRDADLPETQCRITCGRGTPQASRTASLARRRSAH